jgi:hypothetical protein
MKPNLLGVAAVVAGLSSCAGGGTPSELKPVKAFATINEEGARSEALFNEASKVILSPRCMNCHPADRRPTQGDDMHAHIPPMQAGVDGKGVSALPCKSCHGGSAQATHASSIKSLPGNPRWGLAPASMAWQGKSLHDVCEQIKDPKRNGGLSLARIHHHMAADDLVGSAWHPGVGRDPAPGTQAGFGELIDAWIATGARCP